MAFTPHTDLSQDQVVCISKNPSPRERWEVESCHAEINHTQWNYTIRPDEFVFRSMSDARFYFLIVPTSHYPSLFIQYNSESSPLRFFSNPSHLRY